MYLHILLKYQPVDEISHIIHSIFHNYNPHWPNFSNKISVHVISSNFFVLIKNSFDLFISTNKKYNLRFLDLDT